jgi:alpha-D-xyloside xylohydrolase
MSWDEAGKTFTINDRKGDFPGMLVSRTFKIVFVNGKNGTGIEPAKQSETVQYLGKEIKIKR